MRRWRVDLHLHSCLSPCAENEMTPRQIAKSAKKLGLDAIALADHNAALNAEAMLQAGAKEGLYVLPAMEVTSQEEVHLLTLFPALPALLAWQEILWQHLPGENRPDYFGQQLVVDSADNILGTCSRLLLGAAQLSIEEIVQKVQSLGGIVIPAHIDRPSFSILGQLGFIPKNLPIYAVELSPKGKRELVPKDYTIVRASDAHTLSQLGPYCQLLAEELSWQELGLALLGREGRRIEI